MIFLPLFNTQEMLSMERLNLPTYSFNIKSEGGRSYIFDRVRQKYVALTPEEWVRQHFVAFMNEEKHFPASLTRVEMYLEVNRMGKRCDAVFYDRTGTPRLILECKAPGVSVTQKTFDQIAAYNRNLQVDFLVVTNGITHYACAMDYARGSYRFLQDIPDYRDIESGSLMH